MSPEAVIPLRLLLIEDNQDVCEALQVQLLDLGYSVETASDGRTGLDLALSKRYDAIICDLNLPGLDGLDIGRTISAIADRPYLIAHTAFGRPEDRRRTTLAGFDRHVTKGVDPFELERTLAMVTRRA